MSIQRKLGMAVLVLGLWCVASRAPAAAGEKKDDAKPDGSFLSKTDNLTAEDEKDTKLTDKPRKVYKLELKKGKTYKIDLKSGDFDTFLRLEDPAGKEVAFNDDAEPPAFDSRIVYRARKTGEYRIIATCFDGKTGKFTLDVVAASPKEAAVAALAERIENLAGSTPAERKQLVQEFTKALQDKGGELSVSDAQTAFGLLMAAEDADVELARAAYKDLIKVFEGAKQRQIAGVAREFEAALKKLAVLGTEIEIAGKTIDGKDFNLKDLKGKVVLVDFWATWCPPCVAEIPNIRKAYEAYHAKGFEVIGVSLDRSADALTKFQEMRKLPWTSINIEDGRKLAEKYGVNSIPHPVLVDRDGRVVSLRARGPQLDRLLERLLAPKK